MFITNELIRSSISNTPNIVQSSLLDIETFSKDAHKEIISTINEGMTTATERIKYDLESEYMKLNDESNLYIVICIQRPLCKNCGG